MQCQRRVQIYRVKNIGNVSEQSGVAFRLTTRGGGLLVKSSLNGISPSTRGLQNEIIEES